MTSHDELISNQLKMALTLVKLAQTTKSPEMLKQHLDRIEQLLVLTTREADTDTVDFLESLN